LANLQSKEKDLKRRRELLEWEIDQEMEQVSLFMPLSIYSTLLLSVLYNYLIFYYWNRLYNYCLFILFNFYVSILIDAWIFFSCSRVCFCTFRVSVLQTTFLW